MSLLPRKGHRQRCALTNLALCSSLAHLGEGLAGGIDSGEPHYLLNQHIIAMFHPAELFTSVFSAGKSLLWWATTAFISPWPWWLCVIWYAAIWLGRMSRATGLHRPGPITSPLFFSLRFSLPLPLDPSFPLSVLPMNVSISLPMCKLFSPALRADGEQCLCRDFLCMSFLISQRETRFPCSLLEKGEPARACTHTLHTSTYTRAHVLALTIGNQYARCVVGILVQW